MCHFYIYFVTVFLSTQLLKDELYPLHLTYILFLLVFNIFSIMYSPVVFLSFEALFHKKCL